MNVLITEKPSVAMEYVSVFGGGDRMDGYVKCHNDFYVTWAVGHLVTMSYPEKYDLTLKKWSLESLPFIPENYKYELIADVKKQFKIIEKLLNNPNLNSIYYAGDSGREGIYIQSLIRMLTKPKAKSELCVWLDSITADEIKRGIREAKPMDSYAPLIDAAYLRAIEDYLIGINFSRVLSCKYAGILNKIADTKNYTPISVGRVMSCVLAMIVKKEQELRSFKPTTYYKIYNSFTLNQQTFEGEWNITANNPLFNSPKLYNNSGFLYKNDAEYFTSALTNGRNTTSIAKIHNYNETTSNKYAPALYNLAELQNECSKRLKISPDETLKVIQTLYEKKLTTYPRTDARVLTTPIAKEINKNLLGLLQYNPTKDITNQILDEKLFLGLEKSKYVNNKQVTDHYAIIPTGQGLNMLSGLSPMEAEIYDMIVRRFLSIFFPPAKYCNIKIITEINNELFTTSLTYLSDPGYLKIIGYDIKKEATLSIQAAALKNLYNKEHIQNVSINIKESKTAAPKRYNSGSIILAMENAGNLIEDEELRLLIKGSGIGTSATRGEILKKLNKNKYITINKKTQILSPTPLGEMIYEIIAQTIPSILQVRMTASWEKGLSMVEHSEITKDIYQQKMNSFVDSQTTKVKNTNVEKILIKQLNCIKNYYK